MVKTYRPLCMSMKIRRLPLKWLFIMLPWTHLSKKSKVDLKQLQTLTTCFHLFGIQGLILKAQELSMY